MTTPSAIHLVALNNGKANALDGATFEALERELDRALATGARAIVLTGYQNLVESIEASSRGAREAFLDCWFSDEARKRREAMLKR